MSPRHFLSFADLDAASVRSIVRRAQELKAIRDPAFRPFMGKTLAMIFAKNSTRTRVSFESGMARLGGHALFLHAGATQLGRDEPLSDTARVLSRMCHAIMIRNDSQADQQALADASSVPVINGLSELHHPCQMLADLQTWIEHRGEPQGRTVAWVGDGNNVCHSWMEAATMLDFQLRIACPEGYDPDPGILAANAAHVTVTRDPQAAVRGVDVVVTDTWTSMGQEEETQRRLAAFAGFCVDDAMMALADGKAIFMHCLPAHRGEEVSASVIDGEQSVIWDEAENRMWAQMALLEHLWKA